MNQVSEELYEVERRAIHAERPGFRITELQISKTQKVPWHYHSNVQDTFYVLEGELEVAVSDTETVLLGPGGFAVAPPGTLHTFGVPQRARFLNIHAPGMSFATYLREVVALAERGEKPSRGLFERFDMHVLR
jgi:quercetin dioxygenase-like cupin family protein